MDPGYLRHKLPVNASIGNQEFLVLPRPRPRMGGMLITITNPFGPSG